MSAHARRLRLAALCALLATAGCSGCDRGVSRPSLPEQVCTATCSGGAVVRLHRDFYGRTCRTVCRCPDGAEQDVRMPHGCQYLQ